jgi:hypothetical protein
MVHLSVYEVIPYAILDRIKARIAAPVHLIRK